MEEFMTTAFWLAVGQIILIDILLGGDNAVVIALACRNLPAKQRKQGIIYGTIGAIVLRVILIAFALALLAIPYLKIVGAALLLWIGVQLMMPESDEDHNINPSDKLWNAVKTVIMADLVMSVDNVIAIAGAAQGAGQQHQLPLVIFGLLVSIPIIVWGSQIVMKLMERFPIIITLGAMLLGWIAGQMIYTDPAMVGFRPEGKVWEYTFAAVGAAIVFLVGQILQKKAAKKLPNA
jgi:YjbE family integral membrane protein